MKKIKTQLIHSKTQVEPVKNLAINLLAFFLVFLLKYYYLNFLNKKKLNQPSQHFEFQLASFKTILLSPLFLFIERFDGPSIMQWSRFFF